METLHKILLELTKSYEYYLAQNKPEEEWDEYDYMMNPVWIRLKQYLVEHKLLGGDTVSKKKLIVREYEKIVGKTVESVEDLATSDRDGFMIHFTDGTALAIVGNACGHDVEYAGLFYELIVKTNPPLIK